jgi:hypothetical protein
MPPRTPSPNHRKHASPPPVPTRFHGQTYIVSHLLPGFSVGRCVARSDARWVPEAPIPTCRQPRVYWSAVLLAGLIAWSSVAGLLWAYMVHRPADGVTAVPVSAIVLNAPRLEEKPLLTKEQAPPPPPAATPAPQPQPPQEQVPLRLTLAPAAADERVALEPTLPASEQALPAENLDFKKCGTQIDFVSNPSEAARRALKERRLLFVLHLSGNFEDSKFT